VAPKAETKTETKADGKETKPVETKPETKPEIKAVDAKQTKAVNALPIDEKEQKIAKALAETRAGVEKICNCFQRIFGIGNDIKPDFLAILNDPIFKTTDASVPQLQAAMRKVLTPGKTGHGYEVLVSLLQSSLPQFKSKLEKLDWMLNVVDMAWTYAKNLPDRPSPNVTISVMLSDLLTTILDVIQAPLYIRIAADFVCLKCIPKIVQWLGWELEEPKIPSLVKPFEIGVADLSTLASTLQRESIETPRVRFVVPPPVHLAGQYTPDPSCVKESRVEKEKERPCHPQCPNTHCAVPPPGLHEQQLSDYEETDDEDEDEEKERQAAFWERIGYVPDDHDGEENEEEEDEDEEDYEDDQEEDQKTQQVVVMANRVLAQSLIALQKRNEVNALKEQIEAKRQLLASIYQRRIQAEQEQQRRIQAAAEQQRRIQAAEQLAEQQRRVQAEQQRRAAFQFPPPPFASRAVITPESLEAMIEAEMEAVRKRGSDSGMNIARHIQHQQHLKAEQLLKDEQQMWMQIQAIQKQRQHALQLQQIAQREMQQQPQRAPPAAFFMNRI